MENTFGLHCAVCPHDDCRRLNPSKVGEPRPTICHACGQPLDPDRRLPETSVESQTYIDTGELPLAHKVQS